ncbi:MAG: hypothetical protein HYS26_00560 [Candidatus Kaiserbacteria bacterium]|nr:MAG: hypothetical protein HYS26_00560 [Candidatus Kaiserbacteria bacterium]
MQWIRSHPYVVAIIATVLLLAVGFLIVVNRSAVSGDSGLRAWGGGGSLLNPLSGAGAQTSSDTQNIYTSVRQGAPFNWQPVSSNDASAEDVTNAAFESFLEELAQAGKAAVTGGGSEALLDAYEFIPKALISIETESQKPRTASQSALYEYGNEAGSLIQSFEDTHRNMPQVLKDQFEDRDDEEKRGRLVELASSLSGVGRALRAIEFVPSQAASANKNLAESYIEIGLKLSQIPNAANDDELLKAMLAYNTGVETFIKNYVALATLFSISGVTFRSDEPGSVFLFSSSPSF